MNLRGAMLEKYTPKHFGKEYCNLTENAQYPMFVATALGVKPCYDDWVPIEKYNEFVQMCRGYGLFVEPDVIFVKPSKAKEKIVGGENITTTFAEVAPFDKNVKQGKVHIFVAKSKEQVIETKKSGWYPGVINNRSINKPFMDHLRFGKNLGFPECCIDFFRRYNNWPLYSHPYESFKNTPLIKGKAGGSYLCNNFLMDNVYFFIHHIPCSYQCEATIKLAKKVEEKIREVEPEYIKKTIGLLKKPLLVFGERNFVIFDGKIENGAINYSDYKYFSNPAREEDKVPFSDVIKKGDKVLLDDKKLIVMKNNKILNRITGKKEWFMIDFD